MSKPEQSEGDRSRDQLLAGEYVLGVLSESDRRKVEARMRNDRPFAAMVADWQENLSAFDSEYQDEVPPAKIFASIDERLFPRKTFQQQLSASGHWWNSLPLWRGLAFVSMAAMITYASLQSGLIGAPAPARILVADMAGDVGSPISLMARYDTGSGRLQLMPVAADAGDARSLQLWFLPDGGDAPISLGVFPQTGEGTIDIPSEMRPRMAGGVTFAVSVEPYGGSPTGQPTGPVIASGKAEDI